MLSEQEIDELLQNAKDDHSRLTREFKTKSPGSFGEAKERFEKIRDCMTKISMLYKILGKKEASDRIEKNISALKESLHNYKK